MIELRPMNPEQVELYIAICADEYADSCVQSGYWKPEHAKERALTYVNSLLPSGISTPNHYLFSIVYNEQEIGAIWFCIHDQQGIRSAWIFHIEIEQNVRRQGFGKMAIAELEQFVTRFGVESIGLHVFAHNREAQALYNSLGFTVPGMNMIKQLC